MAGDDTVDERPRPRALEICTLPGMTSHYARRSCPCRPGEEPQYKRPKVLGLTEEQKSRLYATSYMHQYKLVINYLQPHSHTLDIQQFIDDNEERRYLEI